ncbi:MAG TPA: hypothetical protein VFJ82_03650 [Longimicrobium sp.]|nr:hypothetical protein [Longimicrobium sp.]
MRVHEVVIVVAMLFAGSSAAGSMARRDEPLKVSDVRTASTQQVRRADEMADGEANPCARTAEYALRCDPARPRALDRQTRESPAGRR